MAVPRRLQDYLNQHQIPFESVLHPHTLNSLSTAVGANVPAKKIAKAVILEDHESRHMMAVLPADSKISLMKLNYELNRSFHLVHEQDVYSMFNDCENGAIPPVGMAYNMDMVYDESLLWQDDVYLEAGDHETLLHLGRDDFLRLMENARHTRFSHKVVH